MKSPQSGPRRRANLPRAKGGGPAAAGSGHHLSPRMRLLLRAGAGLFAVGCVILGGMVAYAAATLPDVNDIGKRTGTIKIYADDGHTLLAELGHDSRSTRTVTIDKISPKLQDATVSIEDRNFYDEGAVNVPRVAKALFVDVIARRPSQGASTITQQLAKQAFFVTDKQTADKSPLRKLREALLANQIDRMYSKQEILDKYLNLIYYGENAYGIESASNRYFNKPAADLNLREASLLAGLPQAPSYLDPFSNQAAAFERQHLVLAAMVVNGKVTQAEADAVDPLVGGAAATDAQRAQQQQNQGAILADLKNGQPNITGPAPHFAQYVQNQLNQLFSQDDPAIAQGSVSVYTTLSLDAQTKADTAVSNGVNRLRGRDANNGALVMLDSHTGAIKAMVGSADYNNSDIAGQFNVATSERQPGSSFKPYVYETAFKDGKLKPDSILQDTAAESARFGGVKDFDRRYNGPITAARALLLSRNIPTEQAAEIAGIGNVINFAHSAGITSDLQANLSTAIGSSAVKMIDHASAYAAFSNGGHKVSAYSITKVVGGDGTVLKDLSQPAGEGDVMNGAQAYSITKILRGYAAQWHHRFNVPTAGKSGTTDNFTDAWYMVYTPDVVVATWAGHTEADKPGELGMSGGVFGNDEADAIAVPFVNSLNLPRKEFTPVAGALSDCNASDSAIASGINSGCSTPTPAPTSEPTPESTSTPEPTPTPEPTATPGPTATACPTPRSIATPLLGPTSPPRGC